MHKNRSTCCNIFVTLNSFENVVIVSFQASISVITRNFNFVEIRKTEGGGIKIVVTTICYRRRATASCHNTIPTEYSVYRTTLSRLIRYKIIFDNRVVTLTIINISANLCRTNVSSSPRIPVR